MNLRTQASLYDNGSIPCHLVAPPYKGCFVFSLTLADTCRLSWLRWLRWLRCYLFWNRSMWRTLARYLLTTLARENKKLKIEHILSLDAIGSTSLSVHLPCRRSWDLNLVQTLVKSNQRFQNVYPLPVSINVKIHLSICVSCV